jgi:hypothetical protein
MAEHKSYALWAGIALGLGLLARYALFMESRDLGHNLDAYELYCRDNPGCRKYLREVTNEPVWRLTLLYVVAVSVVCSILYYLTVGGDINDRTVGVTVIFMFVNFLGVYKLLMTYQYHWICAYGCVQCSDMDPDTGKCRDPVG